MTTPPTPPKTPLDSTRPRLSRLAVALASVMVALLAVAPPAAMAASNAMVPACGSINVRTAASTAAAVRVTLTAGTPVTVTGTVTGAAWATTCPTAKSGSGWYQVSAINGRTVSSLYGVATLYAATGVLTAATAPAPTPTPAATATAAPTPSATPAPSAIPTIAPAATTAPSATPAPTAAPSSAPAATTFTLYGRGWGHGVGLSQYGALGRAQAGQSAATILAHYYPGTTQGRIAAGTQIRVLLLDGFAGSASVPLTITGRGGAWKISGVATTFAADSRLRAIPNPAGPAGSWQLTVDAAGTVVFKGTASGDFRVEPAAAGTTLQLVSLPLANDLFRGSLRVILGTASASVVNEVDLEAYLRGVIPVEMPSSWPLEARIAQTIAARSYAAYRLRPGVSIFDVYPDTRSQVYGGVRAETSAADAVVASTAGTVLLSGGGIANALFHSSDGGATENNENVFVTTTGARVAGPVSYLRGSSDRNPAGASYDAGSPYATWQSRTYTVSLLSAILATNPATSVGTLSKLDLHDRGVSGRLVSVTLVGSAGTKTVSGEVFVNIFNAGRPAGDPPLYSTLFALSPIP